MKYTETRYAFERSNRTFIKDTDGKLKQIIDLDGDNRFVLLDSSGDLTRRVLSRVDFTPIRLGYLNHNDSVTFTTRIPMRRDWKQGLRPNNLNQTDNLIYEQRMQIVDDRDLFKLSDVIENKYPTYKECLENIEETHQARAFHKHFAIDEEGGLHYKGSRIVGKAESETVVNLNKEMFFLKESLEEAVDNKVEVRIAR